MQPKNHLWINEDARDVTVRKPSKDEKLKECFIQTKMFAEERIWEKITAHPNQKCRKSQGYRRSQGRQILFWWRKVPKCGYIKDTEQVKDAGKEKLFTPCFLAQKCLILQYGEFSIEFWRHLYENPVAQNDAPTEQVARFVMVGAVLAACSSSPSSELQPYPPHGGNLGFCRVPHCHPALRGTERFF